MPTNLISYIDCRIFFHPLQDYGCDQSLATNALKHLMDQLEERILSLHKSYNNAATLQQYCMLQQYCTVIAAILLEIICCMDTN